MYMYIYILYIYIHVYIYRGTILAPALALPPALAQLSAYTGNSLIRTPCTRMGVLITCTRTSVRLQGYLAQKNPLHPQGVLITCTRAAVSLQLTIHTIANPLRVDDLQGYLAHKKQPTSLGPP